MLFIKKKYLIVTGNAEMTDVFKCKKAGTQCCAPKSKVQEVIGVNRNDSFPLATTHTYSYTPHTHTAPYTLPFTTPLRMY